ncbi:binding partner of ACD11 1-like [Phoenix dactylifera]|uniref:Binding partner of ACD11 1-like n=1 Tax=Phoenix dactylifera TaxID=42345 RepID=A0A8B8ZGK3_PHODC|nr:binding partner of ACD11 1-like [Phoenix dactylifera]
MLCFNKKEHVRDNDLLYITVLGIGNHLKEGKLSSTESAVRKVEDVVSSMLAKGFVLSKDALKRASDGSSGHKFRISDRKHGIVTGISVTIRVFSGSEKKGGLLSKKRKHNDTIIENLVTEIGRISSACEGSREDFKRIANFFEKKGQSDERRMALFEEIMKIEDFSEDDMLIAGEVISKDKSKIDFFFTLPQ